MSDDEDSRPYSQREEWKDVVPLKQDDGPLPLVPIRYPPGFEETHDYFRAIMAANEISERAFNLTYDVIDHNSANYTAWWYRRKCITAIDADLDAEWEFTNNCSKENAKNYQVWYHRRWLVTEMAAKLRASDDPDKDKKIEAIGRQELEYHMDCMQVNDDFKNYNGWSHRLYVIKNFKLWDDELQFVEGLLALDIRNNSAWNHRFTVVKNTAWPLTEEVRKREVNFAIGSIRRCANNESAWNYLSAFFGKGECREPWNARPEVEAICHDTIAASASQDQPCRFAVEALANVYEAKGEIDKAIQQYQTLKSADAIRTPYWEWRIAVLEKNLNLEEIN